MEQFAVRKQNSISPNPNPLTGVVAMHVVQQHRLARSAFLERAPPSRPRAAENSNDPYLTPTQSRVVHNALIDGFNFSGDSRMGRMGWLSLGAGFAPVAPLFNG